MPAKKRSKSKESNFWDALTTVLIASMNKGQFPLACLFFFLLVMLLKMPSESVAKLAFSIEEHLVSGSLVGYVTSTFLASGWFVHARWQRRIVADEMKRVGEEKSKLQEAKLEIGIESSQT